MAFELCGKSSALEKRQGTIEFFPEASTETVEADRQDARKRAYATEDDRRLGLCLSYVKHFKLTNPGRLQEIATDFQLTFA